MSNDTKIELSEKKLRPFTGIIVCNKCGVEHNLKKRLFSTMVHCFCGNRILVRIEG